MSPLCDLFARDNTNDGGGWDVRFHHFHVSRTTVSESLQELRRGTRPAPRRLRWRFRLRLRLPARARFPEEWNKAPITCDWGRTASFVHTVQRQGAALSEMNEPRPFFGMTRPTDADVDAMSAVYQASWKGPSTFNWAGPEVGYIVESRRRVQTRTPARLREDE